MEEEGNGEKIGVKTGFLRKILGEKQAILKRNGENTC